MKQQIGSVERPRAELPLVTDCIKTRGLQGHEQFTEFFQNYNLNGVTSSRLEELLDLCSPTPKILEATNFGRDIYGVSDNFVCLTSGEDEGFILYSRSNGKVFDVDVNRLDDLEAGKIEATWQSFFDLIQWYLD